MSAPPVQNEEELKEKQIQENIANWQNSENPLAPLLDEELDIIYEAGDLIKSLYYQPQPKPANKGEEFTTSSVPQISSLRSFIKWMVLVEKEVQNENFQKYDDFHDILNSHKNNCSNLYDCSNDTLNYLQDLKTKYEDVTGKTNYLHDLSEQLMAHQNILRNTKSSLNEKLKHFTNFNKCQESLDRIQNKINSEEFINILNTIDEAIHYLDNHMHFKESRIHRIKYESILTTALNKCYNYVNNVVMEITKQIVDPDLKVSLNIDQKIDPSSNIDSAFSLYYGKFQSASSKVKLILNHLEEKSKVNEQYKNIIIDCQKTFLAQRLPIISVAVSKALTELKEKHKNDHSILFRSCCLFTMKVCQDEATCYSYFFSQASDQLNDYLGSLCQYLYDTLRPNLIIINHVEILSELCGILKREMLNEKITSNDKLVKYIETIKQLLEDAEERLVFRTNVFFQYDLLGYQPSPGDLAYPEKLEYMENFAMDLRDGRESRISIGSIESQEVAQINSGANLRSYTGNSPADLHGMWYPTVKRTLVCLSRLYFCLDRHTFQGIAQEALVICIQTVQHAADLISQRKTIIDGRLFQIKHLLIIREQIAPFQVDFTVKEMSLDFSTVQKAAYELIQKRNNLFKFGTNNALLEFLLEGTPKVKEYLVDSRKEIDKQLKLSCEAFISHVTQLLIGNVLVFIEKAEHIRKIAKAETDSELTVAQQDFAQPKLLAGIIAEALKQMKTKIPDVQRSMQLYLANKETEFILFRPIKNNILNAFIQVDQIIVNDAGYTADDQLLIACPSPEQINILICSVSLSSENLEPPSVGASTSQSSLNPESP